MLSLNLKRKLLADATLGRQLGNEFINFLQGGLGGLGRDQAIQSAGAKTLTDAENGKTYIVTTATAAFTLPVAGPTVGPYYLMNTIDANISFVAPASNDSLIADGDAGGDSVTCSTASHKIGSVLAAIAVETVADTWKWFIVNLGSTTVTVA